MVNNEIWMDSGAMVSMIPEQDIYLGIFKDGGETDNGSSLTVTLNDTFTGSFALVTNLYRGCELELYLQADDTFQDKTIIMSNDATTITFNDSVIAGMTADSQDYYGIIKGHGAPIPAPKGIGSSVLETATITTAGDDLLASQAIVGNGTITGVSGLTTTGAELQLTLSSASTPVTFAAESGTNYDTGYLVIYLANSGGDRTLAVAFNCTAGTTHPATGFDEYVEVNVADGTTAVNMARAVQTALANESVTVTRAGAVLTITNDTGGYVNSGVHMTKNTTASDGTLAGVTLGTDTDGGIITAVEITNSGSSVSGSGNLPITSAAGTDAVLALAAGPSSGNPRLLADSWLGLTDTVGIPTTSIAVTPINISSGSRNIAYNLKGAESTASGNLNVSANHFTWLYYALGDMDITSSLNETAVVVPSLDTGKVGKDITSIDGSSLSSGSGNNFIYDSASASPGGKRFYRVVGNTICPPIHRIDDDYASADLKAVNHTLTNKITYEFSESNEQTLPTFALEYSLKKPSSMSTVATDVSGTGISETVFTKIFPGCMVDTLNLTATAGEPVSMNVAFSPKKTFTAPNNYDTANAKTDVKDFVNFGSPKGGAANVTESQLQPFFFSDGSIEMFGQDYIRIESIDLSISNALQEKRFIGRTDNTSMAHIPSQRIYGLSFTGLVTDNAIFEELRNTSATSLSGTDGNQIKLNFVKNSATDETLSMVFKDYMVVEADFPLTNDKGPVSVTWRIQPLQLHSCTHATNWVLQG